MCDFIQRISSCLSALVQHVARSILNAVVQSSLLGYSGIPYRSART